VGFLLAPVTAGHHFPLEPLSVDDLKVGRSARPSSVESVRRSVRRSEYLTNKL